MPAHRILALAAATVLPLAALCAPGARAEVVDSDAHGFTSRSEAVVAVAPDRLYADLCDVSRWWNPEHSWSGDAANLSLEPVAGGAFAEALPGGGSVEHLRVVFADPGRLLRLAGGLGPLQGMAVYGALSFEFTAAEGGTRLVATYAVTGYAPGGLDKLAGPVDGVLAEQVGRLAAYADR